MFMGIFVWQDRINRTSIPPEKSGTYITLLFQELCWFLNHDILGKKMEVLPYQSLSVLPITKLFKLYMPLQNIIRLNIDTHLYNTKNKIVST